MPTSRCVPAPRKLRTRFATGRYPYRRLRGQAVGCWACSPDSPRETHWPQRCSWPPPQTAWPSTIDERTPVWNCSASPLVSSPDRYGRYMHLIEKLLVMAHQYGCPWVARDVDLALYWLGGEHRPRTLSGYE